MKNLFTRLMLVAVATMGIVACQTEPEIYVPENNADAVSVSITAGFDDTRSAFDELADGAKTYTSSWTANETVRFSLNQTGFVDMENTAEGKSATFNVSFTEGIQDTGSIYAFSPKGNYSSTPRVGGFTGSMAQEYTSVYVVVPSEQTPQTNSCDEGVHLLTAKYDYEGGVPTTIDNMPFKHLLAYGKMEIKGFEGTIKSVKLTADTPLSGNSVKYFFTANEPYIEGADNYTLVLDATNVENNVFWFGCIPAVLDGTTLTVVVTDTEENTYTKNIDLTGKELAFKQGRVANFAVSFKDIAVDEVVDPSTLAYQLVKDASQLSVGKYVIIAASDYDVAMSTDQKSNNRGQATITKYDDIAEVSESEAVQYILLEEGAVANTYAFNVGNGYLYAASSGSNHLKTQTTNDGNSSWKIEISGGPNNSASIVAQGSNTRNVMQYNQSSSLFSCYASDSQKALALYVGVDPSTIVKKTALATPVLNATLEGKIITLSWDSITNAKDYTVTFGNNEPKTVVDTTTTFDGEWNTSYEITVVANPVDDTKYIQSSATISVAIPSDPSSTDKVDILNRALTGVTGTSYTAWSSETNSSTADYAGQSAGGNNSIQLRATNPSGIVTTVSGGKATKVVVTWNSNTAAGRTLDVYGKNTAYSNTADLYSTSTSTQGTKIGSIVCGTSTELIIDGVYQYIGMRSKDGAMYIDEIQITWAAMTADDVVPAEPLAKPSDLKAEVTENTIKVFWAAVTGATSYKVSINDDETTTKDTNYTFTDLTADTEYTISVVALGDGETTTDSEVATIDVTTAKEVSGDTTTLIDEEFDNNTTADSSTPISTSKFPNFSGATSKAYTSQYGGVKLGTGSAVGYITSKSLDLSKAFTVTLDACKYSSDTGDIVVTVNGVEQTIDNSELGAEGAFKTFTLTFDAATATSTVKIATSSKRAYIDNVKIAYAE